ncbi:MAG: 1-acyl-sn-glycerol-3-phosphate acyltransferase, partial [Rhodospirillales bacterium]|nr:1-acyl-sn-glycerol-3-phosphate acyltransferase [Rhodospirillales bacterium]
MTALRALLFNVFFLGWTGLLAILFLLLLPFPWRVLSGAVAWWARTVLWMLKHLVGLGYEVRGAEHLPEGPVLVAAKHQSAWDTIVISVLIDHPAVVLKRELFWLPVWGWLAWRCG